MCTSNVTRSHHTLARFAVTALAALAFSAVGCAAQGDETEEPSTDEASQEGAFTSIPDVPSTFPSESGWALSMIGKACNLPSASLSGAVGSIERTNDGVVYSATRSNQVIASAWARSTFIGASKRCLSK